MSLCFIRSPIGMIKLFPFQLVDSLGTLASASFCKNGGLLHCYPEMLLRFAVKNIVCADIWEAHAFNS